METCGLYTLRQNESQLRYNVTMNTVELSGISTLIEKVGKSRR